MQNCALLNAILGGTMQMNFDSSSYTVWNDRKLKMYRLMKSVDIYILQDFPLYLQFKLSKNALTVSLKGRSRPPFTCHIDSV